MFAGLSAQRRVEIPSGWSNDQRVLCSVVPGAPPAQKLGVVDGPESLFDPLVSTA